MLLKLTEFAKRIGYCRRTIFKKIQSGDIKPHLIRNGINYFTEEQVKQYTNIFEENRITVAYSRVSTVGQKEDLKRQERLIELYTLKNGIIIDRHLRDIGSGIDFKRKNFVKLLKLVFERSVSKIFVTYEDRLARFAVDLLRDIFEYFGTELIVLNAKSTTPQEELVEDLMTIIHVFSSRLYGLRRNKGKIEDILNESPKNKTSKWIS